MDTTKFGIRSFNTYQNTCYDCFSPVPMGIPTHIDITHKQNDVNLLNKSWLNVEFQIKWKTDKDIVLRVAKETYKAATNTTAQPGELAKPAENTYNDDIELFLGWKNAAECIRRLEVWNGDRCTGYVHTDNDMETFITFTKYTNREEKRQNRTSHTIFEDLDKKYQNFCGTKIKSPDTFLNAKVTGNNTVRYAAYGISKDVVYTNKFSICIPITEIPALRYFKEFPGCFGPITLKVTFDAESLVYYIKHSLKNHDIVGHRFNKFSNIPAPQYTHHTGNLDAQTNAAANVSAAEDVTFYLQDFVVTTFSADIQGYNISSEGKNTLAQEFSGATPYIIPCLYSAFKMYDGTIEAGVFNIEFPIAVHNLKDIHLAFPTNSLQRTTFKNPMLKNLQMKIHNVLYPKIPIDTYGQRFYKLQINSFDPDKDYMNSLLELPNDLQTQDIKTKCDSDDTAFIVTIPLERDNEPNAFDGFESGDENINFQLLGRVFSTDSNKNVYGLREDSSHNVITEPSPFIWFTSKTFWTADVQNGLVFHMNETPNY